MIDVKVNGRLYKAEKGKNLLAFLQENGFSVDSPCGGRQLCGKCRIFDKQQHGYILACQNTVSENMDLQLDEHVKATSIFTKNDLSDYKGQNGYGMAIDIGTTTVAYYLVDLSTKTIIDQKSELNDQRIYGADVISRISYCQTGKLGEMGNLIHRQISNRMASMMQDAKIDTLAKAVVVGNTTMMHIFTKEDPSSLGYSPYTPVFLESRLYEGYDLGIPAKKIIIPPAISAFVGADLTAGILSSGMLDETTALLIDLGTNGEIVLKKGNDFFATSTATGPAFEGANIEKGMGGVEGAINHVRIKDDKIAYETISGNPIGLSGSGLIDLVAILLKKGIIDETGCFDTSKLKEKKDFYLTENVYLTQKDIRQFQLAKSAVISGIETLAEMANVELKTINMTFLAGGFGFYLNLENAFYTGLLPKELRGKITSVGNSAGSGAIQMLLDSRTVDSISEITENVKIIDLSNNRKFTDRFMNNMLF